LGEDKIQPTDFDAQVKAYRDTVFSCVNINATAMAGMPLRLYVAKGSRSKTFKLIETRVISRQQKDYLFSEASLQPYLRKAVDIEEVIDHPFFDLMKNVNGFNNQFDLIELTGIFLELTGNAYWYLPKNGLGVPTEIWVLYSQWMRIVPDPQKFIKGYILQRGMKSIKFDESEIVHFKYPSPSSEFYGMGPLMGAANAYNLEKNMTDYEKAIFKNMGRPDIALLSKQGLKDKDARDRLIEMWKSAYGGPGKAGKVAVLQGDLEIKDFGFAPREMSYLAGRKRVKEMIANAFGIPMSMLTTEAVNLANAKAGNYQHARNAILPRCRRFEEKLNEKLLPMYPVKEDEDFVVKKNATYVEKGIMTRNEVRQKEGLEKIDGLDSIYLPLNLMPIGSSKAVKEKEEFDKIIKDVAKEIVEKVAKKDESSRERKWYAFIKRQSPWERKFRDKLRELFSEQEKEVLANMKRSPKSVKKGWEEDWLFNEKLWIARFGKEGKPFIGGVLEDVGTSTLADLAVGIDFDVDNPRVQSFIKEKTYKFSFEVNKTTIEMLKKELAEGIELGESIPNLRKRVNKVFGFADKYRATRIARTETLKGANAGTEFAFIQSDIVESKEFLATQDDRVCEWCASLDGKTAGLGENFFNKGDSLTVGGKTMTFDYEDIPYPPIHSQCRCTIIAVLKE